jgi:hypothetical protein
MRFSLSESLSMMSPLQGLKNRLGDFPLASEIIGSYEVFHLFVVALP